MPPTTCDTYDGTSQIKKTTYNTCTVVPHELVYVTGVILEEAETKCGGETRLKRAIDNGRVKEWEGLYYFKRGEVGATRTWSKSQGISRGQERPDEDWDTFDKATEGPCKILWTS